MWLNKIVEEEGRTKRIKEATKNCEDNLQDLNDDFGELEMVVENLDNDQRKII